MFRDARVDLLYFVSGYSGVSGRSPTMRGLSLLSSLGYSESPLFPTTVSYPHDLASLRLPTHFWSNSSNSPNHAPTTSSRVIPPSACLRLRARSARTAARSLTPSSSSSGGGGSVREKYARTSSKSLHPARYSSAAVLIPTVQTEEKRRSALNRGDARIEDASAMRPVERYSSIWR